MSRDERQVTALRRERKHEPQPNELDHYQTPSEVDEIGEGQLPSPPPPIPPF
jgi:hypothetical protein